MITANSLTKHYDTTLALDRLSLEVPQGSVFGLLGPNGAGKTTFLRLVMGFVFPDSGSLDRGGLAVNRIGYLPERVFYPSRFTVRYYLATVGQLAGLGGRSLERDVDRLLDQFGLADAAGLRLSACSKGMLQRLGVAQALIGDPPFLLLDEPVLGLDPAAQKFMRDQILDLHQQGKTVLLSSHHLDEVTRVCTHIAVLHQGRLVRSGSLATILAPRTQVTITTDGMLPDLAAGLRGLAPGITVEGERVVLEGDGLARKKEVLRLLLDRGVDVRRLSEQQSTLEEVYLEATGG